ncbi:hypothetical protein F899_00135, partial [Acinetobacter sp. CIP 101934]
YHVSLFATVPLRVIIGSALVGLTIKILL